MDERTDTLEREVNAIKIDLAELKQGCARTGELSKISVRTATIEAMISANLEKVTRLQVEVDSLRDAVIQMNAEMATMRRDIDWIKAELAEIRRILSNCASKADLAHFATKQDFAKCATKEDVAKCATKEDVAKCATKEELRQLEARLVSEFATKAELFQMESRLMRWIISTGAAVVALQLATIGFVLGR